MLIQEYQERWRADFEEIKRTLEQHISTTDLSIAHIGSTSVRGLAAKPIIDIDLIHEKPASFDAIQRGLEQLGYYHNGDQGIKGREVFKRDADKDPHEVLDAIKHHVYVCQSDREELARHIRFRDYLRANEAAGAAYAKLKFEIAAQAHQDRKAYAKLKESMASEFVLSILNKANPRST